MEVKIPMTRTVVYLHTDDDLRDAHDLMMEFDFRHMPVLEGSQVVGMLSDRDVLLCAELTTEGLDVPALPVHQVMATDVITCQPDATVAQVASVMLRHKIDGIPITDQEGSLLGLITSSDLLELLARSEAAFLMEVLPFEFEVRSYRDFAA